MEIRTLRTSDAAAWWQLRRVSLLTDPCAFGKTVEEHESTTVEAAAARFREVPAGGHYLGAFDGTAMVGMVTFLRDTTVKERHKGRLYGVYVATTHRRAGLARKMIHTSIELAKQDPTLEQILLAVGSTQHAAQRLYQEFGFETFGVEPYALKVGATYVDELHMILRIKHSHHRTGNGRLPPESTASNTPVRD